MVDEEQGAICARGAVARDVARGAVARDVIRASEPEISTTAREDVVARVLLLGAPFGSFFDYACAPDVARELMEGDLLLVPFGKASSEREKLGVLWSWTTISQVPARIKLKRLELSMRQEYMAQEGMAGAIAGSASKNLLSLDKRFCAFLEEVARYTMTRRGFLLQSVFAPLLRSGKIVRASAKRNSASICYRLTAAGAEQQRLGEVNNALARRVLPRLVLSKARGFLLAQLAGAEVLARKGILKQGISAGVLDRAEKLMLVERVAPADALARGGLEDTATLAPADKGIAKGIAKELDEQQSKAASSVRSLLAAGNFSCVLLDGETGSGKTEVYFEAIAACLAAGKQALLLLPEIALSLRFRERFCERFGFAPLLYHSGISMAERRMVWQRVASGCSLAVLGARSALFLPFCNLGVIVVDEEHDGAYKQEDGIVYHARDMAVLRGQKSDCLVLLVSATPSLESWHNAREGKYSRIFLPRRFGEASLPKVTIVDMLKESLAVGDFSGERFLTPTLCSRIEGVLERGEQALVFLNRRGYAPLLLCVKCGERLSCRYCNSFLVEHRLRERVICHHCSFSMSVPRSCVSCGSVGSWKSCGTGIERLSESLTARFPKACLRTLSSDTKDPRSVVRSMESRECDILLGTQMLAKGYHFPYLTLVGIVDADLGLSGGDPRSFERCYQLLHQVSGRAGRAGLSGEVVVQTLDSGSSVLRALSSFDRDGFFASELSSRSEHFWPPFARLGAVILSARNEPTVAECAYRLRESIPRGFSIECFGPSVPLLSPLRGYHRRRFLIRSKSSAFVRVFLEKWLSSINFNDVRVKIDIDPRSFM